MFTDEVEDFDAFDDSVPEEGDPETAVDSGVFGRSAPAYPDALRAPTPAPSAFGLSPDGLGGPIEDFIEPDDVSDVSAARSAGFTLLGVAAAAGIGYAIKGGLGAVSGVLLFGAVANGYRAQKWWRSEDPSEKHEAIVSAVFAAGGLAAGGYVGYKARKP